MGLLAPIEETDYLIIVDAVLVDEAPGTIVRMDFESIPSHLRRPVSSHEIDIIDVLRMADILEKRPPTVIIGIQPRDIVTYGTELTIESHIPALIKRVLDELRALGVEAREKES